MWIEREISESDRDRALIKLRHRYKWKSWRYEKENDLQDLCFTDLREDKEKATALVSCVVNELKMNI